MAYHIYPTKDEAEQRSRDDWEAVLGRPKNPDDVTEFLYTTHEGVDGRTAVNVPDDLTTLGISEDMAASVVEANLGRGGIGDVGAPEIVEELDPTNWPPPSPPPSH
jgi:hypothetical protein